MKRELEEMRAWARTQIENGDVPEWSWPKHVALIEAVDSLLHDMAVLGAVAESPPPKSRGVRLVGRADARSLTELSLGMTQPTQYQPRRRARNLH